MGAGQGRGWFGSILSLFKGEVRMWIENLVEDFLMFKIHLGKNSIWHGPPGKGGVKQKNYKPEEPIDPLENDNTALGSYVILIHLNTLSDVYHILFGTVFTGLGSRVEFWLHFSLRTLSQHFLCFVWKGTNIYFLNLNEITFFLEEYFARFLL